MTNTATSEEDNEKYTDTPQDAGEDNLILVDAERLRAADISIDDMLSVLSNRRRREVLRCLKRTDGSMTVRELTERIAARENDTTREGLEYEERKRVYTSLYQNHLPKMGDLGLIEYDRTADEISLPDPLHGISLRISFDERPPEGSGSSVWPLAYGGLATIGLGVAFGIGFGVPPLDAVSATASLGIVAGLFLVTAATHLAATLR